MKIYWVRGVHLSMSLKKDKHIHNNIWSLQIQTIGLLEGLNAECEKIKKENKSYFQDLLLNQYLETFIIFLDIGIGNGNDMAYFHYDSFEICIPMYFGAVLTAYICCIINATVTIKSMAFHQYMTVFNDKVRILKEMLNNDVTTTQLLGNFQHNYTILNRVSIWKKKELLKMPMSFKLSSCKMQEMMKIQLSLFDYDKQFKEYLVRNGHYVFHPPGKPSVYNLIRSCEVC